MKDSFHLALRYLLFYKFRSLILIVSLAIIIFLPNGLKGLIEQSEVRMMDRAASTPLIIGKKGSPTDLVINSLYFEQEKIETMSLSLADELDGIGFGYAIPTMSSFSARGYPIVGTTLDYLSFRDLSIEEGRMFGFLGECVIGSQVAANLNLQPGDSLISSSESFFDFAGIYPLKMTVVGVLKSSDTPDDQAVFVDLKTNWVIMGLGHGHQDLTEVEDPTLVLDRNDSMITAGAKLFLYNEITRENSDSFHFHGDESTFPVTSILFIPNDEKASTLLRGRFESATIEEQIVVPEQVIDNLLQRIFRVKQIFDGVFIAVAVSTVLILALIVALSLRLRKDEIYTLYTIGSGKGKVIEIVGTEIVIILSLSIGLAWMFYSVSTYFVDYFIQTFIL